MPRLAFPMFPVQSDDMELLVPTQRRRREVIEGFDADAISAARMLLGLDRKELAAAVGVSDRALGAWERGENVPTAGKLHQLVAYMNANGVTVEDAVRAARQGQRVDDGVERAILEDKTLTARDRRELIRLRREMQRP